MGPPYETTIPDPTSRRRYRLAVDYRVEVEEITMEWALERWERRRTSSLEFNREHGFEGTPLAIPHEPRPRPDLVRAQRRLQEAIMAEPRFRDRWSEFEIKIHHERNGLDDPYRYAAGEEEIVRPLLDRLPEASRALLLEDMDEAGMSARIFALTDRFEARPLAFLRCRPTGDGYRAVTEWEVRAGRLTEEIVRGKMEDRVRSLRDARPRSSIPDWLLGPPPTVEDLMPEPAVLKAQQQLLEALLADEEVLDRWGETEVLAEFDSGMKLDDPSFRTDDEAEEEILAAVTETLPPPERTLIQRSVAEAEYLSKALPQFYDAIEREIVGVAVRPAGE